MSLIFTNLILFMLIALWVGVLGADWFRHIRQRRKSEARKKLTMISGQTMSENAVSINRDESILIGDEMGEVRITFLSVCEDDRVRLGITAPASLKVFRREKDSKEKLSDRKLYEKELKHWQSELKRSQKERRDKETLAQPTVDKYLLDGEDIRKIAKKCGVSKEFIAKRQTVLEKAGSFDTPLFEI